MMSAQTKSLVDKVTRYQERHKGEFLDILSQLVQMETPSLERSTQGPILDFLQEKFHKLGLRTHRLPGQKTGGHLAAFSPREEHSEGAQLLIGHCDTVWKLGTLETMPLRMADGWMHGPGVYDMKAGVVQILFALQTLQGLGQRPRLRPVILINSDEEIGSFESSRHIHRLAKCVDRALILEPSLGPEGKLKTARKGVGGFRVKVKGTAAHAGLNPEHGASAILELSHVIQELFSLNDAEAGTTVNVGMIDGGVRANVIAAESTAKVDVRVRTAEDARKVEQAIAAIRPVVPGVELEIEGKIGRPPLEPTPRNQELWKTAQSLGRELGLELEQATAGGGSDGNTTSLYVATLDGLGAVGRGAHALDEAIDVERTLERAALLTLLMMS